MMIRASKLSGRAPLALARYRVVVQGADTKSRRNRMHGDLPTRRYSLKQVHYAANTTNHHHHGGGRRGAGIRAQRVATQRSIHQYRQHLESTCWKKHPTLQDLMLFFLDGDPSAVKIFLLPETDDRALSHALMTHEGVEQVSVMLIADSTPAGPNSWSSLRQVLSNRVSRRFRSLGTKRRDPKLSNYL